MLEAMGSKGDNFTILQIDAHIDWREIHMEERYGLSSTMRRASEMSHIKKMNWKTKTFKLIMNLSIN